MSGFYLVQRLERRNGHGKGFDALFGCEYMGRRDE